MSAIKFLCRFTLIRNIIRENFTPKEKSLERNFFGLQFSNPVGLAAGFDKNAKYLKELQLLGFGFVEIGTVTPLPQAGNAKPRLFRLPKDKALVNRMGFNNDGAEAIAARLRKYKLHPNEKTDLLIVGGNIGKNKATPNEEAWKDYAICFNALHEVVDYFVVNVSSPNTPGLRDLQQKDSLKKILTHLQGINHRKKIQKPLLLKISPDLSPEDLDDVIDLALEIKLDGLVAANTTISREGLTTSKEVTKKIGQGGLSGKILSAKSIHITRYIFEKTKGTLPVVTTGGIFNGEDARNSIAAGAALVQVWTGFVYEGPSIVKKICKALA